MNLPIPPVFPTPQFSLLPDFKGVRPYGNVDNRMEVHIGVDLYHVALAVPSGLFTLMKTVFKVPPEETVNLLLMEDTASDAVTGDAVSTYTFSLMYGEDHVYDLWAYSEGSLPRWLTSPEHRV